MIAKASASGRNTLRPQTNSPRTMSLKDALSRIDSTVDNDCAQEIADMCPAKNVMRRAT